MHYALDICLLLIIVFTVFLYYKRGLIKTILGFGKTILSVIFAFIFGKTVGTILSENIFNNKITTLVYNGFLKVYGESSSLFDLSRLPEKLPRSILKLSELCGVNISEITSSCSNETAATAERLHDISTSIAYPVSEVISNILGYLIVFAISYLLLILVGMLLDAITELPVIHFVNKFLGLVFGCICAVVYSWLFVLVTKVVLLYILAAGNESSVMEIIDKTFIFKFFIF